MKKSGGYQGAPRTDYTQAKPKDTDASLNPEPATTPQIKPIKKFQMVPDAPLAPKPFVPITPTVPTPDPFGTPITPAINLAPTGLNSGFGIYGNKPPIDTAITMATHDEALKKAVPPIIEQTKQASIFDAKLDDTFVKAIQNIPTDDVDRFKQEYANQKKVIAGMIEQHKNFTPDIANYSFNEAADEVARSSFSSDNAGNLVIPNIKPLKAKLDSSFYANLNAIIQHEKKNGKLADGIKDSDVVDAVMGGEWLWHSFMGGQYSDLAKKYAPFFDKYEQTSDALHLLDGEYQKRGGSKAEVDTPVTKGGQPVGENGELRLKGVKVPESELNWSGNSKRVIGDLLQGASNVTFDAAGNIVAGTAGLVGAGYDTQKSIQHGFEGAGSKLANAVNGAVDLLTLKPLWSDNSTSTVKDDWHEMMKLFDTAPYIKEGTATEVSGALQSVATTEGQQQTAKRSDSAIRNITQTVSEMVMGMYGGDFYMAGKVATGLGKGVMAAKSGVDALRLGMKVEKAEAATLIANRLFKVLEAEGKAGADIVAGTTEGRNAMLMFKAMLPKSADYTEAAHLATTMMLQTVAQHANNLGIDDIKEGMISGNMFGIMNIGFSKIAGSLAQKIELFETANAKTIGALTGKVNKQLGTYMASKGTRKAGEIMDMMMTKKKVYMLLSQMVTQPIQTKISEAMTTGNWSKVLDIEEYNNRHAITDMVMGSLGLRDFMHPTKHSQEHRDAYRAMYEEQVRAVAAGEKSPMDARKDLINLAIDINKQTQQTGTVAPETPIAKTKPSGKPITIEKQLAKKGKDVTARDLTEWVRSAGGDHILDEVLSEFALGTEGDTKVNFVKDNMLADGTPVPGKYNYQGGVKSITLDKTLTTEGGLHDAREELMHNVFNTKIDEPNSPYLREGMNILSKVVQHPEFVKAVEDHFQGDKDMAAEVINKYFNVENTEGNQGVKEFVAGVGNNYGMKEVLSKLSAGGKKTFLDKAKEFLVKMIPWSEKLGVKLSTKQKITYLDEYMGLINSAREKKQAETVGIMPDESGSLVKNDIVNYGLKIQDHLDNPKLQQRFKKFWGTDQFWDKVQSDFSISKKEIAFLKSAIPMGDVSSYEELIGYLQQTPKIERNLTTPRQIPNYHNREGSNVMRLPFSHLTALGGTNYQIMSFSTPSVKNEKSFRGEYHDGDFNNSKGTQVAWARVQDYAENPEILQLQELQSPFQKKGGDIAVPLKSNPESAKPQSDYLGLLKNDWQRLGLEATIQAAAKGDYKKLWIPTGETIARIEQFDIALDSMVATYHDMNLDVEREFALDYYQDEIQQAEHALRTGYEPANAPWEEETRTPLSAERRHALEVALDANLDAYRRTLDLANEPHLMQSVENNSPRRYTEDMLGTINFYEETIGNIVKKSFPDSRIVTDEHGQTWREVDINKDMSNYKIKLGQPYRQNEASKMTDDESGALGYLYGKVISRNRVPIAEMKKLDNDDLRRLKVIYDFLGTKANPGQAFTEAFDFIKDAPTVVPELLKDESISKQLRRVAEQSLVASGRQYDELTPKEKLVAVADALVAMEEKSSDEKLNDLVRIFPKEYVNLYALSESDAEAIKGKYDYAPRTNANDMLRASMGLANINQAEKFINELTKHGDADTYYEGMQVLGKKVIGFDASKAEAWDQAVRSIWKSRVNPEPIDNLSVTLTADGNVIADYIPKGQNRTEAGKVEHQTPEIKGWHTARENWSAMGEKAWFGNGTSQVLVNDMTSGHLIKVHETTTHKIAKDGEVDSKVAEGFDIDKTDDKYKAEIAMLKGVTADGQKFFIPKTGNLGGNVVDVTKTVDYVMEEGGKHAVTRLTELNDANLWHMLNSYALHPDGNLAERYPLLGHYISPTKLQELVNVKGTSVADLKLNDIIKKEAYANGYTTKDGTVVSREELAIAFAKQREAINPMLEQIAKDLAMLHEDVNGNTITSYAYRVPVEKQTIDTHTAELLNQLNAFTHWAVDGAGEQYINVQGGKLPKIQEKYMGLVAGKRYVNYPKFEDALVAMGREKWASKTEDDWARIHGVQVRNGQHQLDFGILDADALKDDAAYKLIVEAFGKNATDGNTVVFHNDHMEVLRNASVVDNADHVKTALYTNENGYMNMHKSDIHFLDIDELKARIEHNKTLPLNEQVPMNYDALIRLADGVKANGMFGLTVSTAMKGKMSYRPVVDKSEGVAYGAKHEPVGLLKADGTLDTDKTSLDERHKENQRLLLHGQQVPAWAKLTMNLYGDKSMSFIAASEPNTRTESPGMSTDRAVRSVDGGGEYWKAVKPHLEAFDHNRLLMINRLTNGYDALSRISEKREYDESSLIDAGLVIENLIKHVEAKENSEFSGVDAAYNMSKDLRAALTPEGKLRPEALPGLMLHDELFFGQKNLVKEMIAQKSRALLDGKDVGATAVVMPDFTAVADFVALRKYVSEKEAQREAEGTVFYHEGEVEKYKEFFNEETGTYADGSQGVTLSRDIIEKLSRELRRAGLPELTLGSKVFIKVTPPDDISSFAPFILTGLTETRNTIIANKEFMLQVSGKDFDGDTVGVFVDSPNWRGTDNVDNFSNLHKTLTDMQMHRGLEKQGQGNIMDAAIKFTNKRADALTMIKLADGNNISGRKVPLSPLHPDHSKFLTDTSRDIGIVVRKINNLAMAFQNTIKSFEPDNNGHRVLDQRFSRTVGGKEVEGSIRFAYMPELMGNYSLIKQLGAVDMFVPHGINMDDLFYGTFIKGAELNGTFKPWSSIDGQDRRTVIDEADKWIKRMSGTVVSQIMKGESFKPDAIDEHVTSRTSAESIFAKAIDILNGYGTNSIKHETENRFNREFEVSRRAMDLKYRKKVDEVVDVVSPVLRFVVQKPNEINHRNNNYVSSLRADYYMYSDPIAKTPQSDLYRTAMVTNLYFGAVNSKDVPVTRQLHPANKFLTIDSDNKGMFFEYRDLHKNVVTKHLREVIRQDGTIDEGFVEDMRRMNKGIVDSNGDPVAAEAVLFHPLVLNSLEVPHLSLSEANFLLGANLANIGKKLESMDTRNNADSFVATVMMSPLGTKLTKDGLFEGTFLSHSIPDEKLTEDITEANSNPLRVLAGAEAYGVIPTMKSGGLLKEFVKNVVNQGYENLPKYDESGAFFYRQKEFRKATQFIKDLFPGEQLDIENPEHLKVLQDKLPKKMEELYGNMIRPKDMPELLDGISSYLASDFSNRLARDNAEHAPTQTFIMGLQELDASLHKHRPSIKEAGGWQAWVQNVTRDGLQHVSMFEDTSRSSIIDKTADNVFVLNKDHEIGVDIEMDQDGVRKVVPIKAGDMYTTTTLLPITQRLASTARWNIVEPHRIIKKAIDTNAGHLQQSVEQAKRIFSQGKGEYKAPDMMPVIEAMQGGFFPDLKVDVVGRSTSSSKEATLRITKTLEDGTYKIFDIDPNKSNFNKEVESIFDEGSFIKREGLHSVFPRYASNVEPGTSNLHERRQFVTEVGQFPTDKGIVPVQGEAFLQAREHARDNGEDLHLFDIASKQWHTLNPDGTLAQSEAPLTGLDPNKLHITSKLENHLVLSEQEYHNVVDELLKQYNITPGSRSEKVEDTIREVTDPNLAGKEKDIIQGYKAMLIGIIEGTKRSMTEAEFGAGMAHFMGKHNVEGHIQKYYVDATELLRHQQENRNINKGTGTDYKGVIADMAKVDIRKGGEALQEMERYLRATQDDDVHWENLASAMFHHDVTAPEGISREELSKQVSQIKSAFSREIRTLKQTLGASEARVIGNESSRKTKDANPISLIDILSVMGRRDLLDINIGNLFERNGQAAGIMHTINDTVATSIYHQNRDANEVAHLNILDAINTSKKKGVIPSVREDLSQWRNHANENRNVKSFNTVPPGTLMDIIITDANGDKRLIQDASYMSTGNFNVVDKVNGTSTVLPHVIVLGKGKSELMSINLSAIDQITSSSVHAKEYEANAYMKQMSNSPELRGAIDGFIDATPLYTTGTNVTASKTPFKNMNQVFTTHRNIEEKPLSFFNQIRSAGEFYQVASSYLKGNTFVGAAAAIAMNPGKAGKEVTKLAVGVVWPQLQNFTGAVTSISKLSPYNYAHLVKFNEVVDGKKKFVTWDGENNPIYKMLNTKTGLLSLTKQYSAVLSDPNIGEEVKNSIMRRVQSGEVGNLAAFLADNGIVQEDRTRPRPIKAVQQHKQAARLEKIQRDINESLTLIEKSRQGIFDLQQPVMDAIAENLARDNASVHIIDGRAVVSVDGKSADKLKTDMLSYHQQLAGITSGIFLQHTEVMSAGMASQINANNATSFVPKFDAMNGFERREFIESIAKLTLGDYEYSVGQYSGLSRSFNLFKKYGENKNFYQQQGWAERKEIKKGIETVLGKGTSKDAAIGQGVLIDPHKQMSTWVTHGLAWKILRTLAFAAAAPGSFPYMVSKVVDDTVQANPLVAVLSALWQILYEEAGTKNTMENIRPIEAGIKGVGNSVSQGLGGRAVVDVAAAGTQAMVDYGKYLLYQEDLSNLEKQKQTEALVGLGKGVSNVFPQTSFLSTGFSAIAPVVKK